jgi:hypothetical protein
MTDKNQHQRAKGKPELPDFTKQNKEVAETIADFKERISATITKAYGFKPISKWKESPCVRPKGQSGFYPPPPMNDDPTKPAPPKKAVSLPHPRGTRQTATARQGEREGSNEGSNKMKRKTRKQLVYCRKCGTWKPRGKGSWCPRWRYHGIRFCPECKTKW